MSDIQAFPVPNSNQHYGMTLRDYFAAKAMQAHLTRRFADGVTEVCIARWAYEMADAMLKAREPK